MEAINPNDNLTLENTPNKSCALINKTNQPIGLMLNGCFGPFTSTGPPSPTSNQGPKDYGIFTGRASLKRRRTDCDSLRFSTQHIQPMADLDMLVGSVQPLESNPQMPSRDEDTSIDLNRVEPNNGDIIIRADQCESSTTSSMEVERTVQIGQELGFEITVGLPILNEVLGETGATNINL